MTTAPREERGFDVQFQHEGDVFEERFIVSKCLEAYCIECRLATGALDP